MTINYVGNGYTSPDFLTGPSPGDFITAASIGLPLQQTIDLLDSKANLTGADFTGAITVTALAASTNNGIEATGDGVGAGLVATSGASGTGAVFGIGAGTAVGVVGNGGGTGVGGRGGVFLAGGTASAGVAATGAGTGAGGAFTGGATGTGVIAQGGAGGGGLVVDAGVSTQLAIDCGTGNMAFTGTSPAAGVDPGFNNYECGASVCKAWGRFVTDGAGNASFLDNYNFNATITVAVNRVTLTFMRAFSTANYAPVAGSSQFAGTPGPYTVATDNQTTTTVDVRWSDDTASVINPSTTIVAGSIHVFGRQ